MSIYRALIYSETERCKRCQGIYEVVGRYDQPELQNV